jgi:hypothetical protein
VKKKCARCHKEACGECLKVDTGSCFYCRLLNFGTPILLKRTDDLDKHTDIILQQNFGHLWKEVYGTIEKYLIIGHDQKTYYKILISDNYEWPKNEDGSLAKNEDGSFKFKLLNNPVTLYVSDEEEIIILKPPNTFHLEEFDINQYLNDELDELEDGEILIYNHMNEENPWGSFTNNHHNDLPPYNDLIDPENPWGSLTNNQPNNDPTSHSNLDDVD